MPRRESRHHENSPDSGDAGFFGRRPVLRFVVIFAVVAAAGLGFEYYCMTYDSVRTYRGFVAAAGAGVARLAGYNAHATGTSISADGRALEVTPECAALDVLGIYCAGVLAFPTTGRRRWIGLAIGVAGIVLFNVFRIAALSAMAAAHPSWFEATHEALMHIFPLAIVLPLWLLWLIAIVRPGRGLEGGKPALATA